MHGYGEEHPKWKDTASARVVNEHVMSEKEQSVELDHWERGERSRRGRWRQLVFGHVHYSRELDLTPNTIKSHWSREQA